MPSRKARGRGDELRGIAQRRAVVAYTTQGVDLGAIFESKSPREGLRSSVLLDGGAAIDPYPTLRQIC